MKVRLSEVFVIKEALPPPPEDRNLASRRNKLARGDVKNPKLGRNNDIERIHATADEVLSNPELAGCESVDDARGQTSIEGMINDPGAETLHLSDGNVLIKQDAQQSGESYDTYGPMFVGLVLSAEQAEEMSSFVKVPTRSARSEY